MKQRRNRAFMGCLCEDAEDVVFAHDYEVFTVNGEFAASVFGEQYGVASFDSFALGASSKNFAALGLFFSGSRSEERRVGKECRL